MSRGRRKSKERFPCPLCGADVLIDPLACPECGSDAHTGWSEDPDKWQSDIQVGYGDEDDFDYDEFVRREFAQHAKRSASAPFVANLLCALCVHLLKQPDHP